MAKKSTPPCSTIAYCIMMAAMIIITVSSSSSSNLYVSAISSSDEWEPTWSRMAAEEAEEVGAIECSGHGRAYLDGLILNGHEPACECNSCYYGPNCSLFNSSCSANAGSGDPYFLEPFWRQHAERSGVLVSGWHRMGYHYNDGTYISELLVNYIQRLHKLVGNAVTHERFIVFGAGASQLLNAAVYAFSPNSSLQSSPAKVVATAPCYPVTFFNMPFTQHANKDGVSLVPKFQFGPKWGQFQFWTEFQF